MLTIICPECGKDLQVPEQYLGQWGKCNHCGKKIQVLVSPLKFSREVYEMEEEERKETPSPAFPVPTPNVEQSLNSAYEPFEFNESQSVRDTPQPLNIQTNKSNLADTLGQLGKSMTGCGCLLLMSPVWLFLLYMSFNLIFGSCNSETSNTPSIKRQTSTIAKTQKHNAEPKRIATSTASQNAVPAGKSVDIDSLFQIDNILNIGSYYQFSGEITLVPEFQPSGYENTLNAITKILKIPGQSCWVLIRGVKYKKTTPWYQVDLFDLNGASIGTGWINGTSLLGQTFTKSQSSTTTSPAVQTGPDGRTSHQRAATPTNMVYVGDNSRKYHRENCRTLRGNKYSLSLDDAKGNGYEPCGVCKPPR